jgi:hypothetical protein
VFICPLPKDFYYFSITKPVKVFSQSLLKGKVILNNTPSAMKSAIPQGREGLSNWCYTNEELYALECKALFRRYWQLACHTADVPEPGDFIAFDPVGEISHINADISGVVAF